MLLLTIESSCDETAAAVVRDGRTVLSSIVASQVKDHAVYGGVVPEIASRKHLETIPVVIDEALRTASVSLENIEGIAVTRGPGLAGALLVGVAVAKAIAFARRLPIVGVNHIEGHIAAILLEREVAFPYVALAVSGGHTHLYRVDGIGRYTILGQTRDDAAGEAFDKVAKLLGLPYPGGVEIDRLAAEGDPHRISFPRPLLHDGSFNFSFSGLKTAVLNHVRKNPPQGDEQYLRDLCASFQAAACDVLVAKTLLAAETEGIGRVVVAGGVACNSSLRAEMAREAAARGIDLAIPSPSLCGDNAAMLAVPGDFYLSRGITDGLSLDATAVWPLDTINRGEAA